RNDSLSRLPAYADTLNGAAGNDTLTPVGSTAAPDSDALSLHDALPISTGSYLTTFIGGTGNDTMTGSYNGDTYVFNLGDGQDSSKELSNGEVEAADVQVCSSVAASSVTAVRSGVDLVFQVGAGGDQVTV